MQNKSQVGGVLTIISGVLGVFGALAFIAGIFIFSIAFTSSSTRIGPNEHETLKIIQLVYGVMGFALLVVSAVAIIGGVHALKKRLWGLALAGAICGIFTFLPLGIVAVIFVAQAQKEFSSTVPMGAGTPVPVTQPAPSSVIPPSVPSSTPENPPA